MVTEGVSLEAKMVQPNTSNVPKPISTSSPAGLAAAQMVTPAKLSSLLLERGPLAIRHITQTLGTEIPSFKDLSSSKQRRLIMSAMESGDRDNCVVFEKIGWGQWSAKIVEAENFVKERELTNAANAKVKDIISQESQRRRSSSNNKSGNGKKQQALAFAAKETDDRVVYIDENALASEDEDEPPIGYVHGDDDEDEDEDDEEDDFYLHHVKNEDPYSFRRRKSSVVFADSPPESMEHELLAQRVRPLLKSRRSSRRSSSKIRTASIFKPTVHLDLPNGNNGASGAGSSTSAIPSSSVTRNNSTTKIDLEQLSNSMSEPTSRRESRVSFSKESSIRSTLLPHKNYHWVPTSSPRLTHQVATQVPPLLSSSSSRKRPSIAKNKSANDGVHKQHSDTDEEDWAAIGAASLRNNSVPPKMDTVASSPNGFVGPKVLDASHIPSIDSQMPPPAISEADQKSKTNPSDDSSAAILLMSLKS